MAQLTVRIEIGDPMADDDGSTARVALLDTSQADAHHPTIAEAVGVIDSADEPFEIVIDVPDGALDELSRYSLWAHVDQGSTGTIGSGDLITTQNIPVDPAELAGGESSVDAPLTRI